VKKLCEPRPACDPRPSQRLVACSTATRCWASSFPRIKNSGWLAGVDQIHVNGIANKFWENDDSVVASIEACLKPMLGGIARSPCRQFRPNRIASPRNLAPHENDRPALHGRRRNHGHSVRPARGRRRRCGNAGRPPPYGIALDDYAKTHAELQQPAREIRQVMSDLAAQLLRRRLHRLDRCNGVPRSRKGSDNVLFNRAADDDAARALRRHPRVRRRRG